MRHFVLQLIGKSFNPFPQKPVKAMNLNFLVSFYPIKSKLSRLVEDQSSKIDLP